MEVASYTHEGLNSAWLHHFLPGYLEDVAYIRSSFTIGQSAKQVHWPVPVPPVFCVRITRDERRKTLGSMAGTR